MKEGLEHGDNGCRQYFWEVWTSERREIQYGVVKEESESRRIDSQGNETCFITAEKEQQRKTDVK